MKTRLTPLPSGLTNILDGPLTHYSLASPVYEPQVTAASQGEPLLENSNLCDILMLERALGGYQLTPDLQQCLLCLTRPILFRFKL